MSAETLNITIEQGTTWNKSLTWCTYDANNPPTYAGDPIDLSAYTARAQIRIRKSSTEKQLEMTTENGMITLGGLAGTIIFHVPAVNTAALDFGSGVWDLELVKTVDGEEVVVRLVEGSVTLSKEVTK